MRRYRNCWITVTAVVCAVGVCAAFTAWNRLGVLTTFAYSAVVGSALAAVLQQEGVRRTWRQVASRGVAMGTTVVGMLGIAFLLDGAALLVFLALAASSPPLVHALRRVRTRRRRAAPDGSPHSLDDVELCLAWCRSYAALQQPQSPTSRLRVVQARQEYLDELERRNRAGLLAWLAAGADPADDPRRYILRQ